MIKYFLFALLPVCLLTSGCGSGVSTIVLEPEDGLIIRISDIRPVKSQNMVIGFVEIENKTDEIKKVSNRELFLYCGEDSAPASVKMPGEWEIDKGLINVSRAKTVRFHVYWPFSACTEPSTIKAKYIRILENEEEKK
jgi:hypothetical protein